MLVLSRKKNESIVIDNDITIVVVEIRGDKVRLGVEAPKEVPVHRREVFDAIRRNEMASRNANPPADAPPQNLSPVEPEEASPSGFPSQSETAPDTSVVATPPVKEEVVPPMVFAEDPPKESEAQPAPQNPLDFD